MSSFDLIVVGAGSAGCVVASQIARQTNLRIGLVESPTASTAPRPPSIDSQRPVRWLRLIGSGDDWDFSTLPSDALASRALRWPRGRGLGGSSRINAMIWFPPTSTDLERLHQASGGQWTLQDMQRHLAKIETFVRPESPPWVSDTGEWFLRQAEDLRQHDDQPMLYQRFTRRGRRWTAAEWLTPQLPPGPSTSHPTAHGHVEIIRANVDRVLLDQQQAVGTRVVFENGQTEDLLARRGVVLCAGAIATPSILIRSGIGERDQLSEHGIDCHADSPRVGQNLQDHLLMPIIFQTRGQNFSIDSADPRDLVRWQTLGKGKPASNIAECGGLFRGQSIQLHVTPTHYLTYPKVSRHPMMTIGVNVTEPVSRGSIAISSTQHDAAPQINPGYLSDPADLQSTIEAVNWVREWVRSAADESWIESEVLPGPKRVDERSLAKAISRYAQSIYHPVGTAAVGNHRDAPLNPNFQVRQIGSLWSVDGSTLPQLTVGNPSATLMMLASMASQAICDEIS